uniref:WD_REPEATS_REGION domain-containing protein n=2 Tax=Globodera pallida TaxID=36090 RepID=A0A183BNC3_GLOPA
MQFRQRKYEPYCVEWCKQKRFGTANIVQLLRQREQGDRKEGSHFVRGSREFYFSLPIVRSEFVVHRPQIFPLRFTPCGDKLIAIGANLQEIQLFTYRGFRYGTNQTGDELFNVFDFNKINYKKCVSSKKNGKIPEYGYLAKLDELYINRLHSKPSARIR